MNHGVNTLMLEEFKVEVENFFGLPYEEKKRLWQTPDNHEGFGQLFVVSDEQKLDWSDMFYVTMLPIGLRKTDLFEKLPPKLRYITTACTSCYFLHSCKQFFTPKGIHYSGSTEEWFELQ